MSLILLSSRPLERAGRCPRCGAFLDAPRKRLDGDGRGRKCSACVAWLPDASGEATPGRRSRAFLGYRSRRFRGDRLDAAVPAPDPDERSRVSAPRLTRWSSERRAIARTGPFPAAYMRVRLDLDNLLGIRPGDTHVLCTAGGVVTDATIRPLCRPGERVEEGPSLTATECIRGFIFGLDTGALGEGAPREAPRS